MNDQKPSKITVTVEIDSDVIEQIDSLGKDMGITTRGALISRLLRELFPGSESDDQGLD